MSVSITLTGLKEENQKRFGGREFECKECGRTSAFEDLQIGIVSSGFDYLCPHCGWWILISTEIMDGKYDESGIERKADITGVRVFLDGVLLDESEYTLTESGIELKNAPKPHQNKNGFWAWVWRVLGTIFSDRNLYLKGVISDPKDAITVEYLYK
jgi:DNA-directed RNA polymerase subunit RPC12/RpoP